jgi:hypothetical protein
MRDEKITKEIPEQVRAHTTLLKLRVPCASVVIINNNPYLQCLTLPIIIYENTYFGGIESILLYYIGFLHYCSQSHGPGFT